MSQHRHLSILYDKRDVNTTQGMFLNKEIKDEFINVFAISLAIRIQRHAFYEKQSVQSSQEHMKKNHWILRRTADQE
jgi:hypothetical protein